MARDYYFKISRKKGPVEILTRSSISPGSQTKVNFKVTVSIGVTLNFTFYKRRKSTNNLMLYVSFDS